MHSLDHVLVVIVVGLNYFMMVIEESSLYTILPKYFNQPRIGSTNNSVTLPFNYSSTPAYVTISMIFLAKNVVTIILNPLVGIVIDKINNYFILMSAQLVGIGILVLYALTDKFLLYIIGRIFDAFVTSVVFIGVFSIISKLFPKTKVRDKYYGLLNALFAVSHSIGPVYGSKVDETFGKEAVFLILIPLWMIGFILTYVLYRRVKRIGKKNTNQFEIDGHELNNDFNGKDQVEVKLKLLDKHNHFRNILKVNENQSRKNCKSKSPIFILKILKDPCALACLVQIFIINLSMFALPPTLPSWMAFKLESTSVQQGVIWSFGFVGYVLGVSSIILTDTFVPKFRHVAPILSQISLGALLISLPFSSDWRYLFIPIIGMYIVVGVVEQVILPLTTYLADSNFESNYGTMSSLVSQSLNFSSVISTLGSGFIAEHLGFHSLVIGLGVINLVFSPISLVHRKINPF